jgi:AcrR family transcriptional regulator
MTTKRNPPGGMAVAIADAAIRVIGRDGFDTVSVRSVAREAGIAAGTVQHHFPSREALLIAAQERTGDRILDRIGDLPAIRDAYRIAQAALRTLLPLDDASREESIVWLAFSAAAATRPSLQRAHHDGVALLRRHIRHLLEYAHEVGQAREGVPLESAVMLLAATVDGLMLHAISETDHSSTLHALDTALAQVIEPAH